MPSLMRETVSVAARNDCMLPVRRRLLKFKCIGGRCRKPFVHLLRFGDNDWHGLRMYCAASTFGEPVRKQNQSTVISQPLKLD